jgi:hypothetical protein
MEGQPGGDRRGVGRTLGDGYGWWGTSEAWGICGVIGG